MIVNAIFGLSPSSYQLAEFFGANIPPCAIVSHTWGDDEVSFDDMRLLTPPGARDLVPALLSLAIREWLSADDEMGEPGLVPVSETSST